MQSESLKIYCEKAKLSEMIDKAHLPVAASHSRQSHKDCRYSISVVLDILKIGNKFQSQQFPYWGQRLTLALFCLGLVISPSAQGLQLFEGFQTHGFLAQGFSWTSINNFYGHSENDGSLDFTEIGINASYRVTPWLSFAAQGLYRHAGRSENRVQLDFGLATLTFLECKNFTLGIRGGRVKNPFGLYNETRDVAFTRPTILLPQGIYVDRTRSLFLSSDGGQLFAELRSSWGDLFLHVNGGVPRNINDELNASIFGFTAPGQLRAGRPLFLTQLKYEWKAGEVIAAVSYANAKLEYKPRAQDPVFLLTQTPFNKGIIGSQPLVFSLQYNGEQFTLTGEYMRQFNRAGNFGPQFSSDLTSESWYLQAAYRLPYHLTATVRYDVYYLDVDDRTGKNLPPLRPKHDAFAKDWMGSLRWDINQHWMVSAEYHRIHGTGWLPFRDNTDRSQTKADWSMVLGLIAFRF